MNSIPNPAAVEPNIAMAAAADERLRHAYRQIASADEQLARVTEKLSKLEHDAAHQASAAPGQRPSRGRPALRAFTGLLLAACIVGAAFVSQSSSGDATKLIIARWMSPVLASPMPLEKTGPGSPLNPVQVAAGDPTVAPANVPTPAAPQDTASTAAPLSPELEQLLQTITQDIANVDQKIEQLKAVQQQVASDSARAIEELKASQEQTTRLIAKISEQNARPKAPVVSPRPTAVAPRQPASPHLSPQARSLPPLDEQ